MKRLLWILTLIPMMFTLGGAGCLFCIVAIFLDVFDWVRGKNQEPVPLHSKRMEYNPPFDWIDSYYRWCNG